MVFLVLHDAPIFYWAPDNWNPSFHCFHGSKLMRHAFNPTCYIGWCKMKQTMTEINRFLGLLMFLFVACLPKKDCKWQPWDSLFHNNQLTISQKEKSHGANALFIVPKKKVQKEWIPPPPRYIVNNIPNLLLPFRCPTYFKLLLVGVFFPLMTERFCLKDTRTILKRSMCCDELPPSCFPKPGSSLTSNI